MKELRHTETNAGNDSAGRAFGLDGNLYLPVVLTVLGAMVIFAGLTLVLHLNPVGSGVLLGVPLVIVMFWVVGLKQGRPAGYDRDLVEHWLGGGNFTRETAGQERILG